MKKEKYPQDEEKNEYRYISPSWLDEIARGLTAGAEKHPGETWRTIPSDEHLSRAMRHINLYRMGDRTEPHIINASMRLMMAFGRYIAYRFGLPFIYINLSMTVDSLLGSTSKNISKIFSDLQGIPCVFMMDEVDAIGMMRGSGTKCDDEMARVVISIMQMIDRMSSDMILIAATNRLDVLDEALIRRFSVRHEVKRFSPKENQEMLNRFVDDVPVDFAPDEINDIVERYEGQAQSYLINVLVERIADKVVGGVTEEEEVL